MKALTKEDILAEAYKQIELTQSSSPEFVDPQILLAMDKWAEIKTASMYSEEEVVAIIEKVKQKCEGEVEAIACEHYRGYTYCEIDFNALRKIDPTNYLKPKQ